MGYPLSAFLSGGDGKDRIVIGARLFQQIISSGVAGGGEMGWTC